MADLSGEMVQRRFDTVASGTYQPEIPGLPSLVFVKMGLKEKGISSRAYSSKLKELMAAGGYFNEALLPSVLEKTCSENGLDIKVLKKQREILKRFYDSIPKEFVGPIDQLTQEEAALLSLEEQVERNKAIEERGKNIMAWQESFFTEEDHRVMEMGKQIEALEAHLRYNTAEHRAREYRTHTELLECARREDDVDKQYFTGIEEIMDLEDRNREALVQLYTKWHQFKGGLHPQFFRTDRLN